MEFKAYLGLLAFFLSALPSQAQTAAEPARSTAAQHFVCNIGYTQKDCDKEMMVLRKALANYRASELGEWTWVLVRSEDWKPILRARKLDPGVPALTDLARRTTFFEEALLAGPIGRVSELLAVWRMGRESLLDLAIRHELGHALCDDINEAKAARVARLLEQRKSVSCEAKTEIRALSTRIDWGQATAD
jgi:hypothetical protein